MRRYDFNGSGKPITQGATVTFTPSDIPSEQVVAYHLFSTATDGGGNAFTGIQRIRVKSNGVTRWDIASDHFSFLMEKLFNSNDLYGAGYQCFTIPFYNMLLDDWDEQDQYQFEPGANASIEIQYVNSAASEAGLLFCGWTQTNVAPKYYTKYYGQQMNIADGAVNGRFNLSEGGNILGFTIPSLGLSRAKIVLNGNQWLNLPGADFPGVLVAAQHGLISEIQRQLTAVVPTGTAPTIYTILMGDRHERGLPAAPGSSYFEIDTNGISAWAGTANELGIWASVGLDGG